MAAQQPPKPQEIVYADMSSKKASVTLAVKPQAGVVVKEYVSFSADSSTLAAAGARKQPARTYAVIRDRSSVSLERESENEPRTRRVDAPAAFGGTRVGFTKLKTR